MWGHFLKGRELFCRVQRQGGAGKALEGKLLVVSCGAVILN